MKGNIHKRVTYEDRFGRYFFCNNSRLRELRWQKKYNAKKFRRELRTMTEIE